VGFEVARVGSKNKMEQFDAFFPGNSLVPKDVAEPQGSTGWGVWAALACTAIAVAAALYMFWTGRKSGNFEKLSVPAVPTVGPVGPLLQELEEVVTLEPKAAAVKATLSLKEDPPAPQPRIEPVRTESQKRTEAAQLHAEKHTSAPRKLLGAELAKEVGAAFKATLLQYQVRPEATAAIITHAVKTLLQQDAPPQQAQARAPQQAFNSEGGMLSLRGKSLPVSHAQEEDVAPVEAGTKEGKINAETNPKLIAYMKSRGLN
jgi:hypothetical protein